MQIEYINPLRLGWDQMKQALFRPFDLRKWFIVGFTAFIANLMDWDGGKGGKFLDRGNGDTDLGDIVNAPKYAIDWLANHPGWTILITFIIVSVIALFVLLTWIKSRGKFMFLHNVVFDTAEVSKPWREYGSLGNSLFLWSVGYGFICFVLFILFGVLAFGILSDIYDGNPSVSITVMNIAGLAVLFLTSIIVIAYISRFLDDFVVPIMFKQNIKTMQAWYQFLRIFKKNPFSFLFYGLLIFLITILVFMIILFAGVFTCCIGFLFLAIPYISSVILLPVSFTIRAFSLAFLAQFGNEFDVSPKIKK